MEEAVERVGKTKDDKLNQEVTQGNKQVQNLKEPGKNFRFTRKGQDKYWINRYSVQQMTNEWQAIPWAQTGMKGDTLDEVQ